MERPQFHAASTSSVNQAAEKALTSLHTAPCWRELVQGRRCGESNEVFQFEAHQRQVMKLIVEFQLEAFFNLCSVLKSHSRTVSSPPLEPESPEGSGNDSSLESSKSGDDQSLPAANSPPFLTFKHHAAALHADAGDSWDPVIGSPPPGETAEDDRRVTWVSPEDEGLQESAHLSR